jgi:hypothetical protein
VTVVESEAPTVSDVLRGDRSSRPLADRTIAAGLRGDLEDQLFEVLGTGERRPIVIRASDLRAYEFSTAVASAPFGRMRGVLVGQLVRLMAVGHIFDDPYLDALSAWQSAGETSDLVNAFEQLDREDRARLATDVTAHAVTLTRRMGAINPQWRPRSAVRMVARLASGAVLLRDHVDLIVGTLQSERASVALFDVTTSPFSDDHERVVRYHALTQTLTSGVAPLRVVSLSSATNELWSVPVDSELLRRALSDVVSTVQKKVAL